MSKDNKDYGHLTANDIPHVKIELRTDIPIANKPPLSSIIQPEKQNIYTNSKNYALATINTTDIDIPVNTVKSFGSIPDDIPVAPVINGINILLI